MKNTRAEVEYFGIPSQIPVILKEAFVLTDRIFLNVAAILQLAVMCPISGAVAEQVLSLTNFVMNDLRS